MNQNVKVYDFIAYARFFFSFLVMFVRFVASKMASSIDLFVDSYKHCHCIAIELVNFLVTSDVGDSLAL